MMILITAIIGVPDKIVIENVLPNSPAAQAGFLPGDVIVSANGRDVHQSDELHDIIYGNLGQPITVAYLRGEDVSSVVIIPRANPPEGEGGWD
jgi:regulator of sigma E protease